MTRDTSREAHERAKADGTITDRQRIALDTLARLGRATAQELDRAAAVGGLWKRLSELKAAGLVTECDVRRCAVTDHLAIVWRLVGDNEPLRLQPTRPRRVWYAVVSESNTILHARDAVGEAIALANEIGPHVDVVELREGRRLSK